MKNKIEMRWIDFILTIKNYKYLQKVAGVSRMTVYRWKTLQFPPNKTHLLKIENAYGVKFIDKEI